MFNLQSIAHTTNYVSVLNESNSSKVVNSGLIFEKEFELRQKNESYTDIIQLIGLDEKAQALQFRLLLNQADDDSTILVFENLRKGSNVIDSSWSLHFNVIKGDTNAIGASKDIVFVLLYNLNQNGGLEPGNYENLLELDYNVADLPNLEDTIKSSIKISHAQGTTNQGFPIDITPSRDEFIIYVTNEIINPKFGLVFEKDTVFRLEDDWYTETMQLLDLTHKAQALQFRLLVNKAVDDNVILTFQNMQKGSNISDPTWILDYNVLRGNLTGNGASEDEILVLLYNLNQNNGLEPGNYHDLFKINYRVADLPALQDSVKSSILISQAKASTFQGFPIDITPSLDKLTVIARNRVGFLGDVNGDGCLDILDIIMVVDHIISRDSLESDEFERADIAPWIPGNELPDPDGFVNVQDLTLLQNIILTGVYPNGTLINACSFLVLDKNSRNTSSSTFYINPSGITMYLNTEVDIRGVQLEFSESDYVPDGIEINTDLGGAYYNYDDEILSILLYDRKGEKIIKAGNNFVAYIPFSITYPENLELQNLILIDVNRQRLKDSQFEIIYEYPPSLPLDYELYQNYPNPFNTQTTIEFSIPEAAYVTLNIYNLLGEKIFELVRTSLNAGKYKYQWNAGSVPTGLYIYELRTERFRSTKKMLLLK
ncbi:MAG: T9SS type A sorting domain-containing protein [Ignavibacteriaceae bacterium]|nr:T9SS type A sorting domain-containing protein [Ignavibacteriaceae bacterium]